MNMCNYAQQDPVTQLVRVLVLCTRSREFNPLQDHFIFINSNLFIVIIL